VDPKTASELLSSGGLLVLDVRTPAEFSAGHIPGASLMPVQVLDRFAPRIGWEKEKPVLVYCTVGSRSREAARILHRHGWKEIYDLEGGIARWMRDGRPVTSPRPEGKPATSS